MTDNRARTRILRALHLLLRHLSATCLLLLLPGSAVTRGQQLPTRDEDQFHFQVSHAELFYDTKLLPDGAEVTTFLHQGIWRKFFFMVEDGDTPVSLVITPCASSIDWRLSLQDLPEGASGVGSDRDELFEQMEVSSSSPAGGSILQTYSGSDRQTFTLADCPPGVLMLEMRARERHASVKMYTTTTPHSDRPYPALPAQAGLQVTELSKHSVTVSWAASPTSERHGQPVAYCVATNKVSNFRTQCAALAAARGDTPPTAPPNAGFGFAWERSERRARQQLLSSAWRDAGSRDDVEYACIGDKLSYTFSGLRAGQLYFLDLFVVNRNTNRSSSYSGVSVQTRAYDKTVALKDGKILTSHVKRARGQKVFSFQPAAGADRLVVAVQPCSARLLVEVTTDTQGVVAQTSTRHLWKLELANVTGGPYFIWVAPKRQRSASFKVFASTAAERYPFPTLADDTAIRVFDRQRGCTSLVVAWLGTDQRLQYCLFVKKAVSPTSPPAHPLFIESNQCVSNAHRKKSEKVMCRNFRYKIPRRSVMTETVTGLKPGARYVIDVYARRPGREALSYQTTWATTRSSHC